MSMSDGILSKYEREAHTAEAVAEECQKDLVFHSNQGLNLTDRNAYAIVAIAAEMRALRLRHRFERAYDRDRGRS